MGKSTGQPKFQDEILVKNSEISDPFFLNWGVNEFKKLDEDHFNIFMKHLQPPVMPSKKISTDSETSSDSSSESSSNSPLILISEADTYISEETASPGLFDDFS